mmetsp:Transcript_17752/g.27975  ORF Transcript_17752/g.27975 Transcript_17752/m.27975 type:complete len:227 (-) Transcript_17752:1489-2169(-)
MAHRRQIRHQRTNLKLCTTSLGFCFMFFIANDVIVKCMVKFGRKHRVMTITENRTNDTDITRQESTHLVLEWRIKQVSLIRLLLICRRGPFKIIIILVHRLPLNLTRDDLIDDFFGITTSRIDLIDPVARHLTRVASKLPFTSWCLQLKFLGILILCTTIAFHLRQVDYTFQITTLFSLIVVKFFLRSQNEKTFMTFTTNAFPFFRHPLCKHSDIVRIILQHKMQI